MAYIIGIALLGLSMLVGMGVGNLILGPPFGYPIAAFSAIVVIAWYIHSGLRKISENPPHVAVLTVFGKRTGVVKKEGWRFFPFFPWYYGHVLVCVERINFDLAVTEVRTPDRAELLFPISVTFVPDYGQYKDKDKDKNKDKDKDKDRDEDKESIIHYLDSGGQRGVQSILGDIIVGRIRQWAFDGKEGPQNWEEAQRSPDDLVAVLLRMIINDEEELPKISSVVPTSILIRYFNGAEPTDLEKRRWGENWEKVEEKLEREGKEKIHEEIKGRIAIVRALKSGTCKLKKKDLGIVLQRINLKNIELTGQTKEAADMHAKEIQEGLAEKTELDKVHTRIGDLVSGDAEQGRPPIPLSRAIEIVQTERNKTPKEIKELKLNISEDVTSVLDAVLRAIVSGGGEHKAGRG